MKVLSFRRCLTRWLGSFGVLAWWMLLQSVGGHVVAAAEVPANKFALLEPAPGFTATVPARVALRAMVWVENGAVHRVSFFANGNEVAKSDLACITCLPPPLGTPLTHTAVWENVPAGEYEIVARGETTDGLALKSEPVRIRVVPQSVLPEVLPTVSVVTTDPMAHEAARSDIAIFELHRSGPPSSLAEELTVHFDAGGTAQRGEDYYFIPESMFVPCDFCKRAELMIVDDFVTFPAGEPVVRVGVRATADEVKEETESVTLALRQPIPAPNVRLRRTYEVGEPSVAKAGVQDTSLPGTTTVSIRTLDFSALETDGADIAIMEIRRIGPVDQELDVYFSALGSAVRGEDYELIPESMFVPCPACLRPEIILTGDKMTIPKGYGAVLLGIRALPDQASDSGESVVIALKPAPTNPAAFQPPPYDVTEPAAARAVLLEATFGDDLHLVSIRTRDNQASERDRADIAIFEIHRQGPATADLEVHFKVDGTAERGRDFVLIPESMFVPCEFCKRAEIIITGDSMVIPAGAQSVLLGVRAEADDLRDPGERVAISLVQRTPLPFEKRAPTYEITEPSSAVAEIVEEFLATIPAVSIQAVDRDASEQDGRDIAIFEVYRTGALDGSLEVAFTTDGSAIRDTDYYLIPEYDFVPCDVCDRIVPPFKTIVFGPQQKSVLVGIRAVTDSVKEGDESMILRLLPPPDSGYRIAGFGEDKVVIHEEGTPPLPVTITLLQPRDLQVFQAPATIELIAIAVDRGGSVGAVDFYANDEKIGESRIRFIRAPEPGTLITHAFTWENVKAGKYQVEARTTDGQVRSQRVAIIVDDPNGASASLVVTAPKTGAVLPAGEDVEILVNAVDPEGPITSVTFYGDDENLGNSVINFIQAPPPGERIQHGFTWRNVPPGTHVVHATATRANNKALIVSAPVKFVVGRDGDGGASLIVTRPVKGQFFQAPADVALEVVATDPEGVITSLTFVGDGQKIGQSTVNFLVAPPPGTPVTHTFVWPGVGAGKHEFYAIAQRPNNKAMVLSATVSFQVFGESGPSVVSVVADLPDADEPGTSSVQQPRRGGFLLRRTGGTEAPIRVEYKVGGTAENGVDYLPLDGDATIAAGETERRIVVQPLPDRGWEPAETVVLALKSERGYELGPDTVATVTIHDSTPLPPGSAALRLVAPAPNSEFPAGSTIPLLAATYDAGGWIGSAEFFANGEKIGENGLIFPFCVGCGPKPGEVLFVPFQWPNVAAGDYVLTVRAVSPGGKKLESEPVKIRVRTPEPAPWVVRKLPPAYQPGEPFDVILTAKPPAGTQEYALFDSPPAGWSVTQVSEGGAWDVALGVVKFGAFADSKVRELSYRVTPPVGDTLPSGTGLFTGFGLADGQTTRTDGDQKILSKIAPAHPADVAPADGLISEAEVTTYAAAWKAGKAVDIDFVTRAGFLWRQGGKYVFDPAVPTAPMWWTMPGLNEAKPGLPTLPKVVNRTGVAQTAASISLEPAGQVAWVRSSESDATPGAPPTVITCVPPQGGSAWAVEWTNGEGVQRWGPFFGGLPEVLPGLVPSGLAGRGDWTVSVDGVSVRTVMFPAVALLTTKENSGVAPTTHGPRIARVERGGPGVIELTVLGGAGDAQIPMRLEMSEDLRTWHTMGNTPAGVATIHRDTDADESQIRFYRLMKP